MIQWIIGKILKFKNLKEELKKQYLLKADIECIGLTKKEVRELIGIENEEYTEDTRIIILKVDEVSIGMIVDAVSEVIAIPQDKIEPPESVVARYEHSFISGVGNLENRLIILLDLVEMIGIGTEAK